MPSAAYYRLKAQEAFQAANLESDARKAEKMRRRGRDYSELARIANGLPASDARSGGLARRRHRLGLVAAE
jgi:hypothetical protein